MNQAALRRYHKDRHGIFRSYGLSSILVVILFFAQAVVAQSLPETRRYAIEVAGIRVGTMTATRQMQGQEQTLYTLISDVKVNFLFYKLTIYYRVDNVFVGNKLMRSTVDAHTNRGDFTSRTAWTGTHYDITADQYKHTLRATEASPITCAVTNLYFSEPTGHNRAFAEYFGDYFTLSQTSAGTYRARRNGREDEYIYEQGKLVKIIKKNPLKNFIIRLVE